MTGLFDATDATARVARLYVEAYCTKAFARLRDLLDDDRFQFSHHNRRAYADSADAFVAMLARMATEVFPDRRFSAIRSLHVIDDVVLLDTDWTATPIVTVPGKFEAGVTLNMRIKSMIVVEGGRITEIRDHNS